MVRVKSLGIAETWSGAYPGRGGDIERGHLEAVEVL